MKKSTYLLLAGVSIFLTQFLGAQGTLPVYSDYLSDNIFMVHPSAAGIGNSAKVRLTHRQQWNGVSDSPALQTISMHSSIGNNAALGGLIFNDKNGFHSQVGFQGAYAYHLNFGNYEALNQLSFGLAASYVINSLDQRTFADFDPIVAQVIRSEAYFNGDLSFAYHKLDGFVYLTAKNILLNTRSVEDSEFKSLNLRRYLLNVGYFFGRGQNLQFEPSAMFQHVENTGENLLDINTKVYQTFGKTARAWFALSYRRSIEKSEIKNYNLITPIAGIEFDKFLISYTYSSEFGGLVAGNGGFHQLTLGVNLFSNRQSNRGYNSRYNTFLYKTNN